MNYNEALDLHSAVENLQLSLKNSPDKLNGEDGAINTLLKAFSSQPEEGRQNQVQFVMNKTEQEITDGVRGLDRSVRSLINRAMTRSKELNDTNLLPGSATKNDGFTIELDAPKGIRKVMMISWNYIAGENSPVPADSRPPVKGPAGKVKYLKACMDQIDSMSGQSGRGINGINFLLDERPLPELSTQSAW